MPAVGGSSGSYGRLIITPDLVPPNPADWDAQEQLYRDGARVWDGIHQQIVRDNALRQEAAQSRGFDEAHRAGAELAEEAKTIAEWHDGVATKCGDIAGVLRETTSGQEQLVRDADAAINAAKLPGERETLLATYHTQARTQTGWGVEAAMALHTSFKKSAESTRAQSLLAKWGDVPASPSVQPVDNKSPGIAQEDDPYKRSKDPRDNIDKPKAAPADPAGNPATQSGTGAAEDISPSPVGTPTTQTPVAGPSPRQASPLSGIPSMPSSGGLKGGAGGVPSGGGMPGMPGGLGGGMPGMPGNPLSGGLGDVPGTASGLPGAAGGVPGATGAGSPAAAFSRSWSTGSAIGSAVPAPSPSPTAPGSPSSALSSGMPGVPAAAASSAPGGSLPLAGQPGAVAPAAPQAVSGTAMGGGTGAPMMLPPGPMGPPAAAVPPPSAATMPTGTVGASNVSASSAAAPSPGAGGATLIPASVVAAGQTAAARERRESADAAAAKELAWKLQHAAEVRRHPIEWAVGVFRSPSGTEMVVTSNDGASYIPSGVYVPRSVRLVAADPLVDDHFRQLWFGWNDPARVMIEYARIRAESGWRLVAAATTGAVTALREEGVEHPPSCMRETNPLLKQEDRPVAPPTLDEMHVHRLSLLWPEVYPRLLRVMEAEPVYQDRIVNAVTALLLNAATTQAAAVEGGIPDAFRRIWLSRGGGPEPTAQEWAEYDAAQRRFNVEVAMRRPALMHGTDPSETIEDLRVYLAHWLIARTAEHIGGWVGRPLLLPDMCYAAITVGRLHIREIIEEALSSVEDDLAGWA